MWIRDYGVDGLRLDATHAIFDDGEHHVLRELRDRVKAANPRALVIAEMETGDERPIREWGHDAQWADELHHALHALLTGERDGYYSGYGRVAQVAEQLTRTPAERLVVCAQNHDQVGNRALGDRLPPPLLEVASAVILLAPHTPLLFMGEEYGESSPFQFFTDHVDPEIATATREGRRREFAAFSTFGAAGVPDPQDARTFERSKLSRREHGRLRRHYRHLLGLSRTLPRAVEVTVDERAKTMSVRRGPAELTVDFARPAVQVRP
jgi:maltooligosyltrehalose trehalohydrolase